MFDFGALNRVRDELTEAIRNNDLNRLSELLDSSCKASHRQSSSTETADYTSYINLNYIDKEGQTPLHKSCLYGNLDMCKLLIKFGASQSIKNKDGWFPIHLASYYGHVDVVMYLINESKETLIDVYESPDDVYRVKYRVSRIESNDEDEEEQDEEEEEEEEEEEDDEDNSPDCSSTLLDNEHDEPPLSPASPQIDQIENDPDLIELTASLANLSSTTYADLMLVNLYELKNLELNTDDFLF